MNEEICSNCGRQISSTDQACVFDGLIVCSKCDEKLRKKEDDSNKPSEVTAETCKICGRKIGESERAYIVDGGLVVCAKCDEKPSESKQELVSEKTAGVGSQDGDGITKPSELEQKAGWLPFSQANHMGIIIAVVFISWAVVSFFGPPESKVRTRTVPKFEAGPRGSLVQVGVQEMILERKHWSGIVVPLVAGLALLLHSFRGRFSDLQGFQTLMGGWIIGAACVATFIPFFRAPHAFINLGGNFSIKIVRFVSFLCTAGARMLGLPPNPSLIVGVLASSSIFIWLGAVLLRDGFRLKKVSAESEAAKSIQKDE